MTMIVSIILNPANKSWIIEKIAEKLAEELRLLSVLVHVGELEVSGSTIVHHMSWAFANVKTSVPSTMFITHLDDLYKLRQVKNILDAKIVGVGICMSRDTMQQLSKFGTDEKRLTFISPAHDGQIKPRRIVIGITTRLYSDGRKREHVLLDVAKRMKLDNFEFWIFGAGWENAVAELKASGASVMYYSETSDFRNDYELMQSLIPKFDYYLYLGLDEGSLGTLDALAAGVKTIITPQGFHLDLPGGITHSVLDSAELEAIFSEILNTRKNLTDSVGALTWKIYAQRHIEVWETMNENKTLPTYDLAPVQHKLIGTERLDAVRHALELKNSFSVRRLLSALSHFRFLRSLRRKIDRIRLKR